VKGRHISGLLFATWSTMQLNMIVSDGLFQELKHSTHSVTRIWFYQLDFRLEKLDQNMHIAKQSFEPESSHLVVVRTFLSRN
jgi:hypothetical protein